PGAGLGGVARARGGAAHRPRITGRMLAEVAVAVTGVGRARVAIVGARRAVRLERAIGRAARAGGAVCCAVVALLRTIDHTVATRGVSDGDLDRVHGRGHGSTRRLLRRERYTDG